MAKAEIRKPKPKSNPLKAADITVIDYNSVRSSSRTFDNEGLRAWIAQGSNARPAWGRVRWIHCNGISWDVLSTLAIEYKIHPLALEDVLTQRGHARSKADYYPQHLFIRVLNHTLSAEDERAGGTLAGQLREQVAQVGVGAEGEGVEPGGTGEGDGHDAVVLGDLDVLPLGCTAS